MKNIFLFSIFSLLFCGCSSSHQISFTIPPASSNSAKLHSIVGIYAPDSLKKFVFPSTLSGGLCQGHEFDLHIGSGILEALRSSLTSVYDTVLMLDTPTAKLKDCFIPIIKRVSANADFSPATFSVMIKGSISFTLDIENIPNELEKRSRNIFKDDFTISAENSGKAQDCHDAVPFLKKAGEIAMLQLRDSVLSRLSYPIK